MDAEPDVAWRSLLGGALTVSRREVLPLAGRAMDADGRAEEGLVRLSVRKYGCVFAFGWLEAVRVERLAGGMVTMGGYGDMGVGEMTGWRWTVVGGLAQVAIA